MVLISKDRVHIKGTETDILCDFGMLSATIEKRFGITPETMQQIVQIAHDDLVCTDATPSTEETERTISVIFTRGRGIFDL